jgi:hypothetical protein
MKYINGKDRDQLEIFSLEQAIDTNKEVRLIDVFVKPHNFIKLVILWFWRPSESNLSVFQATRFFSFKTRLAYGPFLFSPKTAQNAWHGGGFRLFLGF